MHLPLVLNDPSHRHDRRNKLKINDTQVCSVVPAPTRARKGGVPPLLVRGCGGGRARGRRKSRQEPLCQPVREGFGVKQEFLKSPLVSTSAKCWGKGDGFSGMGAFSLLQMDGRCKRHLGPVAATTVHPRRPLPPHTASQEDVTGLAFLLLTVDAAAAAATGSTRARGDGSLALR